MESSFPIPSSFQDLERDPYDLLPYPVGFADDDEATRADSFVQLVILLEQGNRTLSNGGIELFEKSVEGTSFDGEDGQPWNCEDRIQALYTLVRKSSSLATSTRKRLITAICKAVVKLSSILTNCSEQPTNQSNSQNSNVYIVPQAFRDALACHLYMLYTIMIFTEGEVKAGKTLSKSQEKEFQSMIQSIREQCAHAMMTACKAMSNCNANLWKRGVPDESVIAIPCRIAYQMLENSTGATARKAAFGDVALQMIGMTLKTTDVLLNTVVAALVDMMHSYEHMAPLAAELCDFFHDCEDKLSIELLREIGRLDGSASSSDATGKASGIRNVAPFLNELAEKKPQLVLENISLVLPHLQSEPYNLRSAIVVAIGHLLMSCREETVVISRNEDDNEEIIGDDQLKKKKLADLKDRLYDILLEHIYDVSSYTRVAVMKTWASIIQAQCLPIEKLIPVTQLAIDRLQDKTVMVRRSAMQVLTLVLENNPFTDSLSPAPYKEKMTEVREFILENLPSNMKDAMKETIDALEEDDEDEKYQIENATIKATIAEYETNNSLQESNDEAQKELIQKLQVHKFLSSALDFIDTFENANDAFESMLLSSNKSDVTEALRFFVRARHFQLPCAVTGIKQALSLMWSDEKSVQDEVMTAFIDVFICGTNDSGKLPPKQIVDNLLRLVGKANASEKTSIEEAISRLVKDEVIPAEVFLILWSIAAKASGRARSIAMTILSMGATSDSGIVDSASRLRHLLQAGLGDYTEEHRDWATAKSAAYALQRVSRVKPDITSAKFLVLEQIVERLCLVIQGDWCDDENENDTREWFGAAEEGINAIFAVCPAPEQVCKIIITAMQASTFGSNQCHSLRLSRFFFVIGHIALKLLVYSEALSGSVRSANAARTVAKQEEADKAKMAKAASGENGSDDEDDIEKELGVAQAAEAETENKVAEIAEKEIIGRGMIDLFTPLVLRVVANESGVFSSEILMQTSVLTLCKFMCISRSFCEKHLPLLFTALAKAPEKDVTLRANTVIALGDLAFRFPNEVEPYTSRIYSCLRDDSIRVRLHTLMVLTHLILNDMVKVKGQVCEIAMCLRDEEVRIRDMARLLFHELSKRSNNPIYNLLPEIVSRLSSMSVKKEDFRAIMAFLLNFIKKERQVEMLVDKLCQRFPKSTSISQKANIAYCLANVKCNEKCIKILNDHFNLYKDALFDEDVLKNFMSIALKSKKFAKPELKQAIEEWEEKLKQQSDTGLEDEEAKKKAEKAKKRVQRRKNQKKKIEVESSEEEDEVSEGDEEEEVSEEEEEEMEFDDENTEDAAPSKSKEATPAKHQRRGRRQVLQNVN